MLVGRAASATFIGPGDHPRSDRFWSLTHLRAMQAETYESLPEMVLSSDAVIVGRIREIAPGREWRAK